MGACCGWSTRRNVQVSSSVATIVAEVDDSYCTTISVCVDSPYAMTGGIRPIDSPYARHKSKKLQEAGAKGPDGQRGTLSELDLLVGDVLYFNHRVGLATCAVILEGPTVLQSLDMGGRSFTLIEWPRPSRWGSCSDRKYSRACHRGLILEWKSRG